MKLRLACAFALLGFGGSSCGGGSGSVTYPKYATMGMLGNPSSTVVGTNLVFVNAALNGTSQIEPDLNFGVLIDTGSPTVLIDPSFFEQMPATVTNANIDTTINLSLLDNSGNPVVTLDAIPALQLSSAMMDEIGLGGILGGNVLRQFSIQLDYAAPMMEGFCLGCASGPRADVESPGAAIPFALEGGSGGQQGQVELTSTLMPNVGVIPPTRIPVTVTIEGVDHPFILDSGASEVSVRSTLYSSLVADGRAQLMNFGIQTVEGGSNASVTRAKTIVVGGEMVADAPVMSIMSDPPDDLLNQIGLEIDPSGKNLIDGLLGGSFLRNFLVSIDYPHGQLHLQPFTTPPIPDEFRRVGFTIGLDAAGTNFVVASVYPNTDAATQGIMVGDQIVSVDGTSLVSVGYVATADALLDGTPGTSKMIKFGAKTGDPALAGTTISVMVDDLIPNP
jgi:hypothetical protein